jgi:hypothetical protein
MSDSSFLRKLVRHELGFGQVGRKRRAGRYGTALLVALVAGEPALAQTTFGQEIIAGFSSLGVGRNSAPALADLDGDGDLDAIVGREFPGDLRYFENTGAAASPSFIERTGSQSPFLQGVAVYARSAPALGDLDGDGDLDLVIGQFSGSFKYLKNTGSSSSPKFLNQTGTASPFGAVAPWGSDTSPELADLDGDGDLDAVVGARSGLVAFLENTGSRALPAFSWRTGTASPVAGIDADGFSAPALADLDADGDLDLTVGGIQPFVYYFRNTGSAAAPGFLAVAESDNPFADYNANPLLVKIFPELADLDGDGDFDASFGDLDGDVTFLANTGSPATAVFEQVSAPASPFTGIDLGRYSFPDLADLDADGDLDAVVGSSWGRLRFYANTGGAGALAFLWRSGSSDPFAGTGEVFEGAPELADLDHDGDLDLVAGLHGGPPRFFKNSGAPASPAFVEMTGSANPFGQIFPSTESTVDLVDLDRDGDADAVIGSGDLVLRYFRNTGTPAAPSFLELTGSANPFDGITGVYRSSPEMVDYDGDGDFDLVYKGTTARYFRNTGTPFNPAFAERTGSSNPFAALLTTTGGSPDLGDLDGDGGLDILMGGNTGRLYFYRSSWNGFADGFESGNTDRWSVTLP